MTKARSREQGLTAKRAEFRRPFSGDRIFRDEALASMLRGRAEKTLSDAAALVAEGVSLSPFLEVGAGSGQRSLALMNRYSATGVATDISYNALRDTPYVLSLLSYSRTPMLICCDAHHLPFLPSTFSFVFAYQTLHHFDNPVPVVAECYRVLARGGHFFFSEEPLDTPVKRLLRGNRVLSHPPTGLQALVGRVSPLLQRQFWDDGALERSLGMTEARFSIGIWREALQPFAWVDLEVNNYLRIHTDLRKTSLSHFLAGIVGGNAKGCCLKAEGEVAAGDTRERLMCIRCSSAMQLKEENAEQVRCNACGKTYPIKDRIICILPEELEAEIP